MNTSTRVSKTSVPKDNNIVKIAVKMDDRIPQLIEFNQKQSLDTFIQELCNIWNLTDPKQYSLKFYNDTSKNFISEHNRMNVKNGDILKLSHSPAVVTERILKQLTVMGDERLKAAQELSQLCSDVTFATEFIEKQGMQWIIEYIENNKPGDPLFPSIMPAFLDLMEHGIVQWDIIGTGFINRVASLINNQSDSQDVGMLQAALSILENIVLNTAKFNLVEKELTVPNLAMHLQKPDKGIQQNTLALFNALFIKADDGKKVAMAATLNGRHIRNYLIVNVIQGSGPEIGNEMAHQLHVLQTLMLSLLENRMNKAIDPSDQDAQDKIKELRRIAFDSDGTETHVKDVTTRKTQPKDFRKLGFTSDSSPLQDFEQTPPGALALDSMLYFARNQMDKYTRVVLENSGRGDEYDCPFARAAIELTKLLCDILQIGEPPTEQGTNFHPMFFNHDHPFEELFCTCLIVVNKTWKEMRATVEDFDKVFSVVREQISRALNFKSTSIEEFKKKISGLTYAEITELWQKERTSREAWESRSRPIMELREQITPEILELVQQQRLNYLTEGTRFNKYSSRGRIKDKYWYVRLSPNHRVLHYGDCDEKTTPALDELPNKLPVVEIRSLVIGRDCPHVKDARGKKPTSQFPFSLILDSNDTGSLDFAAPDEQTFDYWVDGINALLGNKMTSKEALKDLETLLAMETKLRLLDVEGMDLPDEPPPIPRDPANYDFAVECK
nr:EOG090X02BW [Cyclestheria hislopi]